MTTNTGPSAARPLSAAWPGTITCAPQAITVELQPPDAPSVARALALLIDEINASPPSPPGDQWPITYQLGQRATG